MNKLRFKLDIKIVNEDTGEVLCENVTESVGNTQTIVHATKGISSAVTYAFEIAGSDQYMSKQKSGEQLK